MINFSFLMSLCYKKVKFSVVAAILVYLLTFLPYMIASYKQSENLYWIEYHSGVLFLLTCLFPGSAITIGFAIINCLEFERDGLAFDNLFMRVEPYGLSIADAMFGMLLSSIIFIATIFYFEFLYMDSAEHRKWYYPFYNLFTRKRFTKPTHYVN